MVRDILCRKPCYAWLHPVFGQEIRENKQVRPIQLGSHRFSDSTNDSTQEALQSFNEILTKNFLCYERFFTLGVICVDSIFMHLSVFSAVVLNQNIEEREDLPKIYYIFIATGIIGVMGVVMKIWLFNLSDEMITTILQHKLQDGKTEKIEILSESQNRISEEQEELTIKLCCDTRSFFGQRNQAVYHVGSIPDLPFCSLFCSCLFFNWQSTIGQLGNANNSTTKILQQDCRVKDLIQRLYVAQIGSYLFLPAGTSLIAVSYSFMDGLEKRATDNTIIFSCFVVFYLFSISAAIYFFIKERRISLALLRLIFDMRYQGTQGFSAHLTSRSYQEDNKRGILSDHVDEGEVLVLFSYGDYQRGSIV